MFKLYSDTDNELFFDRDYKPVTGYLKSLSCTDMLSLLDNLYQALDNAEMYGSGLLSIALYDDIVTVKRKYFTNLVSSYGSGTIASFIGKTKYSEIDKAVNKTMLFLYNSDDTDIFPLETDMESIKNLVRTCYGNKDIYGT